MVEFEKIFASFALLLLSTLLFGCTSGQQGQAAAPTPVAALSATPVATVDVSAVGSEIDAATSALGDALNSTSEVAIGDINASDLDYA